MRDLLGTLLQNRFELGPLGSIGVNPGQYRVGVDAAGVQLGGNFRRRLRGPEVSRFAVEIEANQLNLCSVAWRLRSRGLAQQSFSLRGPPALILRRSEFFFGDDWSFLVAPASAPKETVRESHRTQYGLNRFDLAEAFLGGRTVNGRNNSSV